MAGTPKPIGRVLLMPKGDYNATAIYYMLDLVRYDNKTWVCKVDGTTGVTPVEGTNWSLIVEDGADGTDGTDGRGISSVTETVAGKVHSFTMNFDDGSTPFQWEIKDGNDGGGGGSGGDMYKSTYDKTDNGMVDVAEELYDVTNNKKANTIVLAKLSESGSGKLEYDGQAIGGEVAVDDSTIVKNSTSNKLEVPIDNSTIIVNGTSKKVEVPIDNTTLVIDSTSKKMKLADDVTAKLSNAVTELKVNNTVQTITNNSVNIPSASTSVYGVTKLSSSISSTSEVLGATAKAVKTVNDKVDTWFSQTQSASATGEQTITFTGLNTSKAYELWFDTSDGSQVGLKSSKLTGTSMAYTVDIPSDCPVPVTFKLLVKNI